MILEGKAHASVLAALHAASFPAGQVWEAAAMARLLDMPGCFGCLEPGGMALFRIAADEAELLTIAVLPEARGRGVGSSLLAAGLLETARRGAVRIYLEVAPSNQAAISLYRRAGFEQIGRRPRYYPDGSDALVLSCPLEPNIPSRPPS